MNYDDLTAKELKALCEERGIKPSRAKADMIEDLKARDAADELSRLGQEMEQDATQAASQPDPAPEVKEPSESPSDSPVWISDGRLRMRFERQGRLDDFEHYSYLSKVVEEAENRGLESYGPPFRVNDPDTYYWVYAVNVR